MTTETGAPRTTPTWSDRLTEMANGMASVKPTTPIALAALTSFAVAHAVNASPATQFMATVYGGLGALVTTAPIAILVCGFNRLADDMPKIKSKACRYIGAYGGSLLIIAGGGLMASSCAPQEEVPPPYGSIKPLPSAFTAT